MARALFLALILIVVIQGVYYYPQLPATVASHFDGAGEPDGWSSKAVYFAIIGGVAAIMVASFLWLPKALGKAPASIINLPQRDYWLAPERRAQTMHRFETAMHWCGVGTMALIAYVNQLVIEANLSPPVRLPGSLWWVMIAYGVFLALWIWRFYRIFALPPDDRAGT